MSYEKKEVGERFSLIEIDDYKPPVPAKTGAPIKAAPQTTQMPTRFVYSTVFCTTSAGTVWPTNE